MKLTLHYLHPETQQPTAHEMRGYTMKIGREMYGIDLTIHGDPKISRYHARITHDVHANRFWIEDEKSTHGTIINDDPLTPGEKKVLQNTDVIRLGNTQFKVVLTQTEQQIRKPENILDDGLIVTRITITDGPAKAAKGNSNLRRYLEMIASLQRFLQSSPQIENAVDEILSYINTLVPGMEEGGLLIANTYRNTYDVITMVPQNSSGSFSRTLAHRAETSGEAILWQHDTENPTRSLVENQTAWAIYAPLLADDRVWGVLYIRNQTPRAELTEDDTHLLAVVAFFLGSHLSLQHRQAVLTNLQRQFSPQVAQRLLASDAVHLGGERVEPVTILMTDVRGFTRRCAEMDAQDVMETVIDMFSILTPIVFKYGGTVDKYIGDALLAVFGCPEPDEEQCAHAVQAALEMQMAMDGHAFPVGIGVHMGEVMHGFIGSNERMEYTVIGSTVNRAARFCDAAREGQVIISDEVYATLVDIVDVETLPPVPTKHPGIEPDVQGYLVHGFLA